MIPFNFFKLAAIFCLCVFYSVNSYSQDKISYNLFTTGDSYSANNTELKRFVNNALTFSINRQELNNLFEYRNTHISVEVPFTNNSSVKLDLRRFDILKPDAKIVARTIKGNEEVKVNDLASFYTGKIEGRENSFVTLSVERDKIKGVISVGNDNFNLGAIKDGNGIETDRYVLYNESDLVSKDIFHCETEDYMSAAEMEKMREAIKGQMNRSSATDLYVAEIAIEMDNFTYNSFGASITNTTNYAIYLMTSVSALFMKEVNVKLVIPYLRIWTTSDPYTSATSGGLLNQFRSEWNANMQSVPRTVAHYISKKPLNVGGVAWLGVLCNNVVSGYGYGFSNTISQTAPLPTFSYEIQVIAHELGHNFGSLHTFNCSWVGGPIDTCYTVEGGCYTGPSIAAVGTIMSYCYNNGSVSFVLGFGPQPTAVIRNSAENAGCTYVSQSPLQIGYPNGGETFRTGNTTPIYWGSSISAGTVNIELSLNGGTTWQTVQNNIPASQNQYDWTIPENPSTTQAKLRIVDSSNPGVGDTTDAVFKIILNINAFNLISPPALTRLAVSSSSTLNQDFIWQKGGTDPSINYKFFIKKLGNNPEYGFASNNNGLDSMATIRMSLLDSLAQIMGTTADSVRCTWRVFGYNGIDSTVSSNNFLITLVRNVVGINVISSLIPENFSLGNNYPNPFNPETVIKFDIAKATYAELKLYDSRGSEISTFVNEKLQPGSYDYKFNAGSLPSGVYFYRLKTSEFSETKRMMLIK